MINVSFSDPTGLWYINLHFKPVATMLQYRLYGGKSLPAGLQGVLKASANIGSVVGQFGFGTTSMSHASPGPELICPTGYLADSLGRKAICESMSSIVASVSDHVLDGKELMLIIFATIMCLTTPTGMLQLRLQDTILNDFYTGTLSSDNCLIYLSIFRIVLGVGVGGGMSLEFSFGCWSEVGADYPMSASITSDRAVLRKRGTMLAYIFSNQVYTSPAAVESMLTIF